MDVERWQRVERVLDAAFESDPTRWQAIVDASCGGDVELRREVDERPSGRARHLEVAAGVQAAMQGREQRPAARLGRVPADDGDLDAFDLDLHGAFLSGGDGDPAAAQPVDQRARVGGYGVAVIDAQAADH